MKYLNWRMCRGCFPTRVCLQDKGVQCPTDSVSCNSNYEYLAHNAFECPFAVQVWKMAGLWNEANHAVIITNSAIDAIFFCCKIYHTNMFNVWQPLFGVS